VSLLQIVQNDFGILRAPLFDDSLEPLLAVVKGGCEVHRVKNGWSLYFHSSICVRDKHKENFTLTFPNFLMEHSCLLRCDSASLGKCFPAFIGSVSPSCSRVISP
jgi:hypothetical protein